MTQPRTCWVAFWLGLLSVLAIVLANIALQDIYHQEADLRLEWRLVRISFLVMFTFHGLALSALWTTIAKERDQLLKDWRAFLCASASLRPESDYLLN